MPFDFTKYNYDELVQEVTRLVSDKEGWKDAYQSSTGQILIQVVAAITDQLHYMLERRSQENFLPSAKLQSSVNAIANSLGYRQRRVVSSNGTLNITLTDANGDPIQSIGNVVIPKYSTITFDGNNFVNKEEITLLPTQTYPATFDIMEGTLVTNTYDPTDTTSDLYLYNYVVIEDYESIEESSIDIFTSTQSFNDVRESIGGNPAIESLSLATSTDEVYDINLTNTGMRIQFGDGTYGAKPTGTLTIRYVTSSGREVEVQSTGLDFAFESTSLFDDETPQNEYTYILKNSTTIDGAKDAETLEEVKRNAPDYVRTSARAVTKHDYAFWSVQSNVGGIVDAAVYGEEEIGVTVLNMNNVYINYLTSDGSTFTLQEQQDFRDYMDIYKNITTHLVVNPAEVIPLQINIEVKRNPSLTASNSEVYDYIKNDLISYFEFAYGSLGKDIYHSNIVDRYHNLQITKDGVSRLIANYVKVTIKALKSYTTPLTTQSTTATITYGIDGDNYRITINGTDYDYVAVALDDADAVAAALATAVDADAAVSATAVNNVITITTATAGTPFTITNTGTTTPLNNRIDVDINLPLSLLKNDALDNLILPNTVELIQTDGTVIATDDGAGNIYNGTVDYVTGVVSIPIQTNGTYYVRYEQNNLQNFMCTSKQAFGYSLPKDAYSDVTELLSTIVIS